MNHKDVSDSYNPFFTTQAQLQGTTSEYTFWLKLASMFRLDFNGALRLGITKLKSTFAVQKIHLDTYCMSKVHLLKALLVASWFVVIALVYYTLLGLPIAIS